MTWISKILGTKSSPKCPNRSCGSKNTVYLHSVLGKALWRCKKCGTTFGTE